MGEILVIFQGEIRRRNTHMATRKASEPAPKHATMGNALPESMVTGKASTAKAAVGDKPVSALIAGLPQPQRGIAERIDQLAAATLPGLQRSVKWGMRTTAWAMAGASAAAPSPATSS
jgi:hypothetical protein